MDTISSSLFCGEVVPRTTPVTISTIVPLVRDVLLAGHHQAGLDPDSGEVLEVDRGLAHHHRRHVHVPQDQSRLVDDMVPHIAQVDQGDLELLDAVDLDLVQAEDGTGADIRGIDRARPNRR